MELGSPVKLWITTHAEDNEMGLQNIKDKCACF